MRNPRLIAAVLAAAGLTALLGMWAMQTSSPTPPPDAAIPKGGSYSDLSTRQRQLVDDWVARLAQAGGRPLAPQALYDDLGLSTRTTFVAVTHALERTALTRGGQPAGLTALDLVERLETVAGGAPGKGGDKQFRLYVELAEGAQQALEQSAEFTRQVDNTVYHDGYPTCFRGAGGTPSIQISLAPDGRRGDIDVDYRSSTFPVMLINGHLTASNSDVRAGNNDERHNQHWIGLQNWWRSFLGVPLFEAPREQAAELAGKIADRPRLGKGARPEDAVHDFLSAWLVEDAPGIAAGYLAPGAFSCVELERGTAVDRGVARVQMARNLRTARTLLGGPTALDGVVRSVALQNPAVKEMRHAHGALFAMYEIRDDLAAEFDCERRLRPEQSGNGEPSSDFSGYVGAVFRVQAPGVRGEAVATVWSRDDDGWRLVAYDVEPEIGPALRAGATVPAAQPPAPPAMRGDPAMIRSASAFLDAWFVRKDIDAAFRFVAPQSVACYDVFRAEDAPAAASSDAAVRLMRERMEAVAEWAGKAARLEDVLVPAGTRHPVFRRVSHDSAAFTVIALPDAMAGAIDCGTLRPGESPWFDPAATTYGRFYAASTRLKRGGPDAAVLWTIWARQEAGWKVVSYRVLTP